MDMFLALGVDLAVRFGLTVVAVLASVVLQIRARRRKLDMDERVMQVTNLITLPFATWFVVFLIGALEFGLFADIHWLLLVSGITGSLLNICSAFWMITYVLSGTKKTEPTANDSDPVTQTVPGLG